MITASFDPVSSPMIRPNIHYELNGPVPETVIGTFSCAVPDQLKAFCPGKTSFSALWTRFCPQAGKSAPWAICPLITR